jgi:hypothetical protein
MQKIKCVVYMFTDCLKVVASRRYASEQVSKENLEAKFTTEKDRQTNDQLIAATWHDRALLSTFKV